ncbi:MAG: hypothetical protein N3F05_01915 [Candidatus Diapherotrites archaeon]|nr:hypothetical protein [Candidatus Diapherotrites archaeon]
MAGSSNHRTSRIKNPVKPVAVFGAAPWITKAQLKRDVADRRKYDIRRQPNNFFLRRFSKERLQIIKDLIKNGFEPVLMVSNIDLVDKRVWRFCKIAKVVGARVLISKKETPYTGSWLRDAFSVIKGYRFVFPFDERLLGRRIGNKFYSYLGDGGSVVNIEDKFILVSKKTALSAINEINFLKRRGMIVFEMPPGLVTDFFRSQKAKKFKRHHHIDLFVNRIPGMKILVVDPIYYAANKRLVDEIAKVTGYKILQIPEKDRDYYPANFLDLGKGKIMMNRAARETAKLLEREGVEVVLTSVPLKGSSAIYGGLRCAVNLPKKSTQRIMESKQ